MSEHRDFAAARNGGPSRFFEIQFILSFVTLHFVMVGLRCSLGVAVIFVTIVIFFFVFVFLFVLFLVGLLPKEDIGCYGAMSAVSANVLWIHSVHGANGTPYP